MTDHHVSLDRVRQELRAVRKAVEMDHHFEVPVVRPIEPPRAPR